jgi:hypothetical protein
LKALHPTLAFVLFGADEYGPSAFVILLNFSNLAVIKINLRPSKLKEF